MSEADLAKVTPEGVGAAALAVTQEAAEEAAGAEGSYTVAIVISESKRIGIDTGSLDMSEPAQRATLVDAIRVEWCAGLDASACVVVVVESARMRSRRLAPAEVDVERSYDLTMSEGLSQLITAGLQSANVTVTSETLTGLSVTSTITQQGNSKRVGNFPSPDALATKFSAQIPSVTFSVSAPTVVTPPMPPPSAPPAPPTVDRRRKHRGDALVIALAVGAPLMALLLIAVWLRARWRRRKLAKVAVAPMYVVQPAEGTVVQPAEGTRSRMRKTPTPNPPTAAASARPSSGMLVAREETSAQAAASVVAGEAAGAVTTRENTHPAPAAEVPRLPLHLQSDWQSGPPETAAAEPSQAQRAQPPATQPLSIMERMERDTETLAATAVQKQQRGKLARKAVSEGPTKTEEEMLAALDAEERRIEQEAPKAKETAKMIPPAAQPPAAQPPAAQPPAAQPPAADAIPKPVHPPAATPTAEEATSPSRRPSSAVSHRPAPRAPGWAAARRGASASGRFLQLARGAAQTRRPTEP